MKNDDIVYSYTLGDTPKKFNENSNDNLTKKYSFPDDEFIRILIEKNHRGGKSVTIIIGVKEEKLHETCTDLKKKCGSGGTVKENRIEIQGDKRDLIEKYFTSKGLKTKRVGG
jgi:translation initiation factor 1